MQGSTYRFTSYAQVDKYVYIQRLHMYIFVWSILDRYSRYLPVCRNVFILNKNNVNFLIYASFIKIKSREKLVSEKLLLHRHKCSVPSWRIHLGASWSNVQRLQNESTQMYMNCTVSCLGIKIVQITYPILWVLLSILHPCPILL